MISKNCSDKPYFIYLAELFHLDLGDKLSMEDHSFHPDVLCITHTETHRALQVSRDKNVVRLNYLDGHGKVIDLQVYDAIPVAKRTIAFLNRTTDQI